MNARGKLLTASLIAIAAMPVSSFEAAARFSAGPPSVVGQMKIYSCPAHVAAVTTITTSLPWIANGGNTNLHVQRLQIVPLNNGGQNLECWYAGTTNTGQQLTGYGYSQAVMGVKCTKNPQQEGFICSPAK